jgi:hypothetical protein
MSELRDGSSIHDAEKTRNTKHRCVQQGSRQHRGDRSWRLTVSVRQPGVHRRQASLRAISHKNE